jgi:hypothetical protein
MESEDIKKLRRSLILLEREDLANLLKNSTSNLEVSDTYGSYLFSQISLFEIFSPSEQFKQLNKLSENDVNTILEATLLIYPLKEREPEVVAIKFHINFNYVDNDLVKVPFLETVSFDYVREQIKKCEEKIQNQDFEGAVTNARTLMETVCLFVYEEILGENYSYDGNLAKLHKKIADLLKMSPDLYEEQNLKKILSGISSIVHGVSELRNSKSDAHGKSPSKSNYRVDERHAVLVVNLAKTVSEYLYSSFVNYQKAVNE